MHKSSERAHPNTVTVTLSVSMTQTTTSSTQVIDTMVFRTQIYPRNR